MLASVACLSHRLAPRKVGAVVHLGLQFRTVVIGWVQGLQRPHRHQIGPAFGDPGVAGELITNRLAQPEVRAFVADEPARAFQHLLSGIQHADALEIHDDQARQDAAAHTGQTLGRAVPADHDGRGLAADAGCPKAAQVVVPDMGGEVADLLADPRRQVGVYDRGQPLAGRHPRLAQQDVGALPRRGQIGLPLAVEQHRPGRVAPSDGRGPSFQIDAVQFGGHDLGRLDR
ncbi:hypothetical protein D3C71_1133640 [compost metagenome]